MKKVMAVDFDDTLVDIDPFWKQYHLEVYGEIGQIDWSNTEMLERAHKFINSPHHDLVPAMEGSIEAIRTLVGRRTLVILTMRDSLLTTPTVQLLERHFPNVFKGVHFMSYRHQNIHGTKAEVCKRLGAVELVDDGVHHVTAAHEAGLRPFLFHREANKDVEVPGIVRVHSWAELLDHIR